MGTYTKEQLTTQLERIQTAEASTRTAIINRGINFCPADAKLADLAYYAKFLCDFPDIRLDYIENGEYNSSKRNDVYFNTDYIPDTSTAIELKYTIPSSTDTGLGWIIGSIDSSYSNRKYGIGLLVSNTSTTSGSTTTTASYIESKKYGFSYNLSTNTPHTLYLYYNGTTYYTNIDSSVQSRSTTISYNTVGYPMTIYAVNDSGTYNQKCKGNVKIYYIKIWRDNNLERFYVPVLHYYNGQYTPCFYDKVNDNYIYNLGTGTVTYSRSEDIMLDYIGNGADTLTGRYYTDYDTGLSINSSIQLYAGGSTTAIADGENRLCATRGNSSNYKIGFFVPYNTSNIRFIFGYQITINGPSASLITPGARYNMGGYYNSSSNKTFFYFNNAVYTATRTPDLSGFNGYTFKFFDGGAFAGNKIYYSIISYDNIPAGTYIPVLHNDTPAFYNMTDGTYIYNTGQEGSIPSYEILN